MDENITLSYHPGTSTSYQDELFFSSKLKNKFYKNLFLANESYFFKKNKYSFVRGRTCYGVTVSFYDLCMMFV